MALLLDTHVWIWAAHNDSRLNSKHRSLIENAEGKDIFVSAMSCWEVAKLVSLRRITLNHPIDAWFRAALMEPRVQIAPITPEVAIESNSLPQPFHRDPADCIIVATARIQGLTLLTNDRSILEYPNVKTI